MGYIPNLVPHAKREDKVADLQYIMSFFYAEMIQYKQIVGDLTTISLFMVSLLIRPGFTDFPASSFGRLGGTRQDSSWKEDGF